MSLRRSLVLLTLSFALAACGSKAPVETADGGIDAGEHDAGIHDAGASDGGHDAGSIDAGIDDAGAPDAGMFDGGIPDAGIDDGGMDAGDDDAGTDAGLDAGSDAGGGGFPAAPVLTAVTEISEVDLSWTTSDDAGTDTFTVSRSVDNGITFNPLDMAVDISSLSVVDMEVSPGIAYQYQVAATNSVGTGPASNVAMVLAAPSTLAAGGSDTRMVVTWTAIENAESYDVYRSVDAGSLALVNNVSSSDYIDSPVTTGPVYSYLVVSKAPGFVSSIGSNQASGIAFGIDIGGTITNVSDIGVTTSSAQSWFAALGLEAHVPQANSSIIIYRSLGGADGLVIPNVPIGPYLLTVAGTSNLVITDERTLDYSTALMGRADAVDSQDDGTSNDYALSGLSPWNSGADAGADAGFADALEAMSQGAGNFVLALDRLGNEPDAGETNFTGDERVTDESGDGFLVNSTEGDVLYIWQLQQQLSGNGAPLQTAVRSLADTALTQVDGQDNPVDGAMSTPPSNAIADLKMLLSKWSPLLPSVNPAAVDEGELLRIDVERGFDAYGSYGASGDAMIVRAAPGAVDLDVGSVSWQSPIPSSANWDPLLLFVANSSINYTSGDYSARFQARSKLELPIGANIDWTAALAPVLSPPQMPLVNGANAFADQVNTSDFNGVITLSWTAPTLGSPDFYVVTVYQLSGDATGIFAASITTKSTSAAFTIDLLPDLAWYFATIEAVQQSRDGARLDPTNHPVDYPSAYVSAELATNRFTPGAAPDALLSGPREMSAVERRNRLRAEQVKSLSPQLRKLMNATLRR